MTVDEVVFFVLVCFFVLTIIIGKAVGLLKAAARFFRGVVRNKT